ncbi:MAG: Rrf2 family transcriptional regulator [Alphaproteobacteria bacterium]|jgi:Rrf2 family protein|nr:Rrf2 family transcriptional regulator [Alphaproteobacteria bacterium]MDP6623890.1 Rrf2 family transcriptional regulator [Alphaproteobacteria bacterium]|tara:strand:+ start:494 stop:994 length:501 start_codon:yes stop_codon:yes gene_type:complete
MKLQRSTIFALYAVLELARDADTQLATGEIAARYGISAHHLAKVMRQLVRARLIQSARGAGGGYRLAVNPNRVTLMDVVAVFEDRLTSAFDDEASADDDSSGASGDIGLALQAVRDEIEDLTRATLASITLATLVDSAGRLAAAPKAEAETEPDDTPTTPELAPLT